MTRADCDQLLAAWKLPTSVRPEPFWALLESVSVAQAHLAGVRLREQAKKLSVVALRGALEEVTELPPERPEPCLDVDDLEWRRVHGHRGICPPGCPHVRPGPEVERQRQGFRRLLLTLGQRMQVLEAQIEAGLNLPLGGLRDPEVRRRFFGEPAPAGREGKGDER